MKFLLVFSLCLIAAVASKSYTHSHVTVANFVQEKKPGVNLHINELKQLLFERIRHVIKYGSHLLGIPCLDPVEMDEFHLQLPAGLVNLDLHLKNSVMSGLGGFIVHKSELILPDLVFDIDISFPRIDISTELYDISGDFLTAFPLYGNGSARFVMERFQFQAKLLLKRSDNRKSIVIDKIECASFEIPALESKIEGAIGSGDIDHIVNAIVEDALIGYLNRFSGAITKMGSAAFIDATNPILEKLDSWWFIEPFSKD